MGKGVPPLYSLTLCHPRQAPANGCCCNGCYRQSGVGTAALHRQHCTAWCRESRFLIIVLQVECCINNAVIKQPVFCTLYWTLRRSMLSSSNAAITLEKTVLVSSIQGLLSANAYTGLSWKQTVHYDVSLKLHSCGGRRCLYSRVVQEDLMEKQVQSEIAPKIP